MNPLTRLLAVAALTLLVPASLPLGSAVAEDTPADAAEAPVADDDDEEEESPYGDDGDDEDEDEDEDEVDTAEVKTTMVFTAGSAASIPAGIEVAVLVGFNNVGDKPYMIKSVSASMHKLEDYSYVVQNFTAIPVEHSCTPDGAPGEMHGGDQASFVYKFTPAATLDPRDVSLTVQINYSDDEDEAMFHGIAFNSTVTIVDGPSGYFILSLIKNLLLVAGIGYGVSSYMGTDLTELAGKSKKVETGTKKVDNSEFANSAWGKKK